MTSSTDRDAMTFIAGTLAADEQDAPLLVAAVAKLQADDDMRYEALARALEAMASRMTRRIQLAQRWRDSGMLEETDVDMRRDDFAPTKPIRRRRS